MNPAVKQIIVNAMRVRQRNHWKAPANRVELTSSEKKQVDEVWGEIWSKPSYAWHGHFKSVNGSFDPLYLPIDTFYLDLMPRFSNLPLATAWEDKAYYSMRFPDVPFPRLVAACIDGALVDRSLSRCGVEDLWEDVRELGEVFIKPSIGSYQGIGAFRLKAQDVATPHALEETLASSGDNYVVQELIEQHDLLASFNPSSVNVVRIVSVRLDKEVFLANATIRFGIPGRVTDMTYVDGVETVRVAGLTNNGQVKESYYDQDGNRQLLSDIGVEAGRSFIPGFDRACEICAFIHKRLHHFGIVGFDIAIGRDSEPIVIEMNLGGPGAVFYQYANGPFFGERTQEVIEWCKTRPLRQKSWELS